MTVTFSEILSPDRNLSERQAQSALRQQAFEFMDKISRSTSQVVYICYKYQQKNEFLAPAKDIFGGRYEYL